MHEPELLEQVEGRVDGGAGDAGHLDRGRRQRLVGGEVAALALDMLEDQAPLRRDASAAGADRVGQLLGVVGGRH